MSREIGEHGRHLQPAELTEAVAEMAPILEAWPRGGFAMLAVLTGALVEYGGSPLPLAAVAPARALDVLRLRVVFSHMWGTIGDGRPEPRPGPGEELTELVDRVVPRAAEFGLTPQQGRAAALSAFDARCWVNLMITLLAHQEFRVAAGPQHELGELAGELADCVDRAHWLPGLTEVLDNEPLVVLDPATGRGYRLTMSGIGDNFQLYTLLADRLIGDEARGLLPGLRPESAWVVAATDGPPELSIADAVTRRFRLHDATGAYQAPERRPAAIPILDGARVLTLHPAQVTKQWLQGRIYQQMRPTLTLDHVMPADEAASWLARVHPARDPDMFHV
jgi:hypothetical protein